MHVEYFEGVLQLRAPTKEVMEFIKKQIQEDGRVQVTKEKRSGDGVDLYLTSQKFIQKIGKKLSEEFGGQMKLSSRLFSKDQLTSRDIYRINVLFRMPSFKRGEILNVNDREARVLSVKKMVQLQDLSTGEKFTLPFDRVENTGKKVSSNKK